MHIIEADVGNEMSPFEVCLNNLMQILKTRNSTYISLCAFSILYHNKSLNMLDVYRIIKEHNKDIYFHSIEADFNKESILSWGETTDFTHYLKVSFDEECENAETLKNTGFLCDKSETHIIQMKMTDEIKESPELHHKLMYGLRAFCVKDE